MNVRAKAVGIALMCAAATSMMATPSFAKRGDVYEAKKAECKRAAKAKNFGVHFVKRNRWINDCIAGRRT